MLDDQLAHAGDGSEPREAVEGREVLEMENPEFTREGGEGGEVLEGDALEPELLADTSDVREAGGAGERGGVPQTQSSAHLRDGLERVEVGERRTVLEDHQGEGRRERHAGESGQRRGAGDGQPLEPLEGTEHQVDQSVHLVDEERAAQDLERHRDRGQRRETIEDQAAHHAPRLGERRSLQHGGARDSKLASHRREIREPVEIEERELTDDVHIAADGGDSAQRGEGSEHRVLFDANRTQLHRYREPVQREERTVTSDRQLATDRRERAEP